MVARWSSLYLQLEEIGEFEVRLPKIKKKKGE